MSLTLELTNPYASHAQLSPVEREVLWEYAKLGDKIKRIANLARMTAESPNEPLLAELRDLEKKMGLVLTLFKASVWAVIVEHQAAAEKEEIGKASAGEWDSNASTQELGDESTY